MKLQGKIRTSIEIEKVNNVPWYVVLSEKCDGCGVCTKVCPVYALHWAWDGTKRMEIDEDVCAACLCGKCVSICPNLAIIDKNS